MNKGYQIKEHTADVIVKATGKTLNQLFENAALGMMAVLKPSFYSQEKVSRDISLGSTDQSSLLVDFLNELLYQMDVNNEGYQQFKVDIIEEVNMLKTEAIGHPLNKFETEVKAATYHNLEIRKAKGHLEAEVTFDI